MTIPMVLLTSWPAHQNYAGRVLYPGQLCHYPAQQGRDLSMVNVSVSSSGRTSENSTTYTGALAIVTSLFFLWGFVTVLNVVRVRPDGLGGWHYRPAGGG